MERLCYELGGVCGIDPRPFALRELWWMSKSRSNSLWSHTIANVRAVVLAMTGKEPPLEAFVPKAFLPEGSKREMTDAEKELLARYGVDDLDEAREMHRQRKQSVDMGLMRNAADKIKGRISRNGTQRQR